MRPVGPSAVARLQGLSACSIRLQGALDPDVLYDVCHTTSYTTVRLMLSWAELQPRAGSGLDPAYLGHVHDCIAYCSDRFLTVIVCLSQHMFSAHCSLALSAYRREEAHGAPAWAVPRKHRRQPAAPAEHAAYVYEEEAQLLWNDFYDRWIAQRAAYVDMLANLVDAVRSYPCVLGIQPLVDPWLSSKKLAAFYTRCLCLPGLPRDFLWFFPPASNLPLAHTRDAMAARLRDTHERVVWCVDSGSPDSLMYALEYSLQAFDWVFVVPPCHIMFIGTETGAVQQAFRVAVINHLFPWGWDTRATSTAAYPPAQRPEIRRRVAASRAEFLAHGVACVVLGIAWASYNLVHGASQWSHLFALVYTIHGCYCTWHTCTRLTVSTWPHTAILGVVTWTCLAWLMALQPRTLMFWVTVLLFSHYLSWAYRRYCLHYDLVQVRYYMREVE